MLFFSIYDKKNNEIIAEKRVYEQWRYQARADAWPCWIDARRHSSFWLFLFELIRAMSSTRYLSRQCQILLAWMDDFIAGC